MEFPTRCVVDLPRTEKVMWEEKLNYATRPLVGETIYCEGEAYTVYDIRHTIGNNPKTTVVLTRK